MTTRHQLLLVLVGSAAVMAGTAWYLEPPPPLAANQVDPKQYPFLYCEKCGRDYPTGPMLIDKGCPQCAVDLVPSKTPVKQTGKPPNRRVKMYMILFAEAVVLMGLILYVSKRS